MKYSIHNKQKVAGKTYNILHLIVSFSDLLFGVEPEGKL